VEEVISIYIFAPRGFSMSRVGTLVVEDLWLRSWILHSFSVRVWEVCLVSSGA